MSHKLCIDCIHHQRIGECWHPDLLSLVDGSPANCQEMRYPAGSSIIDKDNAAFAPPNCGKLGVYFEPRPTDVPLNYDPDTGLFRSSTYKRLTPTPLALPSPEE